MVSDLEIARARRRGANISFNVNTGETTIIERSTIPATFVRPNVSLVTGGQAFVPPPSEPEPVSRVEPNVSLLTGEQAFATPPRAEEQRRLPTRTSLERPEVLAEARREAQVDIEAREFLPSIQNTISGFETGQRFGGVVGGGFGAVGGFAQDVSAGRLGQETVRGTGEGAVVGGAFGLAVGSLTLNPVVAGVGLVTGTVAGGLGGGFSSAVGESTEQVGRITVPRDFEIVPPSRIGIGTPFGQVIQVPIRQEPIRRAEFVSNIGTATELIAFPVGFIAVEKAIGERLARGSIRPFTQQVTITGTEPLTADVRQTAIVTRSREIFGRQIGEPTREVVGIRAGRITSDLPDSSLRVVSQIEERTFLGETARDLFRQPIIETPQISFGVTRSQVFSRTPRGLPLGSIERRALEQETFGLILGRTSPRQAIIGGEAQQRLVQEALEPSAVQSIGQTVRFRNGRISRQVFEQTGVTQPFRIRDITEITTGADRRLIGTGTFLDASVSRFGTTIEQQTSQQILFQRSLSSFDITIGREGISGTIQTTPQRIAGRVTRGRDLFGFPQRSELRNFEIEPFRTEIRTQIPEAEFFGISGRGRGGVSVTDSGFQISQQEVLQLQNIGTQELGQAVTQTARQTPRTFPLVREAQGQDLQQALSGLESGQRPIAVTEQRQRPLSIIPIQEQQQQPINLIAVPQRIEPIQVQRQLGIMETPQQIVQPPALIQIPDPELDLTQEIIPPPIEIIIPTQRTTTRTPTISIPETITDTPPTRFPPFDFSTPVPLGTGEPFAFPFVDLALGGGRRPREKERTAFIREFELARQRFEGVGLF